MNNIFFVLVLVYPRFKHTMNRIVIRDDRAEMIEEVKKLIKLDSSTFDIDCVAEYDFKKKMTRYYTVDQFLE